MTAVPDGSRIDELMEAASEALANMRYFEAERLACKALAEARQATDFDRMARIVLPLLEARRQRLQQAYEVGTVTLLDAVDAETMDIQPGAYLVHPPAVGADARRLRLAALNREIPIAVLCCEPMSMVGLLPVVAIGLCGSVRTKIDPPADPDDPDLAWLAGGLEELGDQVIADLDPQLEAVRRVDALLERLDAIPDHEGLHQALIDACHAAHRAAIENPGGGGRSSRSRSAAKT
ncbi:MAG: hypothetical protein ACYTGG_01695 [Planctomycetota bacterium]|jgi:hypothetical protein